MKILCTDRALVALAFVWNEAPALSDWLDIIESLQSLTIF